MDIFCVLFKQKTAYEMRISDGSSDVCSSDLRNRWGVRGQLLFEPSDALSIRLIGDYDKIDENCCIAANVIAGPTIAITDALVGGPSVDRENPFSYDVYNNFLSANRIRNYGGSAQIDYDLGNMALTSITA